jgi:hypothetical protein
MELNITELDNNLDEYENYDNYDNTQIPENNIPIKVIKKVNFEEPMKPMHQSIPKVNSKMVRPQMPPEKPKISYEDILNNMGMFVSDGKLHLVDRNSAPKIQQHKEQIKQQPQQMQPQQMQQMQQIKPQNSYIYNKYFKEETQLQDNIRRPKTIEEYKQMLVNDYIQKQKIKQMKSTKLIMPTSNIQISNGNVGNLNKLFQFPRR